MAEDKPKVSEGAAPRGAGKKQTVDADVSKEVSLRNALDDQEGVGTVKAIVAGNVAAVEINSMNDDGLMEAEVFEAGKVHMVKQELIDEGLFVAVEDDNE